MRPRGVVLDNKNDGRIGLGDAGNARVGDTWRHELLKRCLFAGFADLNAAGGAEPGAVVQLPRDIISAAAEE